MFYFTHTHSFPTLEEECELSIAQRKYLEYIVKARELKTTSFKIFMHIFYEILIPSIN